MANKYLDLAGLQRLVSKIKELIPTKTSELDNDSGFITAEDIPPSEGGGTTIITSATEPSLSTGDQWHKEI